MSFAEAVYEAVFNKNAGEIAVVAWDGKVIIKTDIERSWGEFGGIICAPFWRVVSGSIAEMPFADSGGGVAVFFE